MKPMKEKMPEGSVESLGETSRRIPLRRTSSWKEREHNKNRERKRRAITKKIFSGLRMHGDYVLPKHCDNNQVLRVLCNEAGWTVEPDGTTYRKGCKPDKPQDIVGRSISASPCLSYQPSPGSSIHPSLASSSYLNNTFLQGTSLIPWLKNLSSPPASDRLPSLSIHGNSISASVTPALFPSPKYPTFSLVSSHRPFGGFFKENAMVGGEGSSRMVSPLQYGTCSPAIPAGNDNTDIPFSEVMSEEFAFWSNKPLKAWKEEGIHEDCGSVDLELTLGTSKTRSKTETLGNDAGKF